MVAWSSDIRIGSLITFSSVYLKTPCSQIRITTSVDTTTAGFKTALDSVFGRAIQDVSMEIRSGAVMDVEGTASGGAVDRIPRRIHRLLHMRNSLDTEVCSGEN
jgi:hypothetical protein